MRIYLLAKNEHTKQSKLQHVHLLLTKISNMGFSNIGILFVLIAVSTSRNGRKKSNKGH